MDYDLELEKVVKEIKKQKTKTVCIQLPEGLRAEATKIAEFIEKNTKANVFIWADSCFGSCDIPKLKVDLLIQWGHSKWKKTGQ